MSESDMHLDEGLSVEPQDSSRPVAEKGQGLSEEDLARLKRAQKRNLVIAVVLGLLLAIMGFLSGSHLRAQKLSSSSADVGIVQIFHDSQVPSELFC